MGAVCKLLPNLTLHHQAPKSYNVTQLLSYSSQVGGVFMVIFNFHSSRNTSECSFTLSVHLYHLWQTCPQFETLVWQVWQRKERRKRNPKCCEMLGEERTARTSWCWPHGQRHSQSHGVGVQQAERVLSRAHEAQLTGGENLPPFSFMEAGDTKGSWETAHRSLHGGEHIKYQTGSSRCATGPSKKRKLRLISQMALFSFPDWKWPPNMTLQKNYSCFS